jgi:hypothetical protein
MLSCCPEADRMGSWAHDRAPDPARDLERGPARDLERDLERGPARDLERDLERERARDRVKARRRHAQPICMAAVTAKPVSAKTTLRFNTQYQCPETARQLLRKGKKIQ